MGIQISTIVIGFDYSPPSFMALRAGLRIASTMKDCEPHVLLVAEPAGDAVHIEASGLTLSVVSAAVMLRENVEAEARKAALRGEARGLGRVVTHVRVGDSATELLRLSSTLAASAIVLGNARARRSAEGTSVSDQVKRGAHCPVYWGVGASGELSVPGLFPGSEPPSRLVV